MLQLEEADGGLGLRSQLCINARKKIGLRVKDDVLRLRLEQQHDLDTAQHSVACERLCRSVLKVLCVLRVGVDRPMRRTLPATAELATRHRFRNRCTKAQSSRPECFLLTRLPPELRNRIYTFVILAEAEEESQWVGDVIHAARSKEDRPCVEFAIKLMRHYRLSPPLPRTCRQIRLETQPMFAFSRKLTAVDGLTARYGTLQELRAASRRGEVGGEQIQDLRRVLLEWTS